MTTILIVDDHPAMRLILKTHLLQLLGVDEVLEADNGQSALDLVRARMPDLVLLDLDIPRSSGLDVAPRLRAIHPQVRLLVVTALDPAVFVSRAWQVGAQGFVSKTQDLKEILRAVESVLAGYTVFPAMGRDGGSRHAVSADDEMLRRLSDKELVVLQMLARGMSYKAISASLFISNKTVSSYKARIMAKLQVSSLVELVDFARRCHLAL
ncbi:response regulator transcription factor [Cupriavidus oxalaticus]|jgi:two-component system response regulator EvgA|uniref:DNA-binding response regulator n=1 Tax=Cupriavidus oxalaticus TaxID=96344 RepID=A0A375GIE3_9BURK|nr:response regulator transcription factor [Cupriavidus oxalaticus]QEZ44206.1 DNA-binding response regulator [Cupriavidus oxalaticus]QRQ84441.1 response regulator transcription factor [Cupriavidus oxalaticus]QRQ91472.1 response regulator transcription factor [Cupriavidus oxalaticus]WQD86039.1 response regulator transcription factor [Cupriavidus oxalaticus]SPC19672.1 putative transcriptional regulator [Cupriavidus oxalaticus]